MQQQHQQRSTTSKEGCPPLLDSRGDNIKSEIDRELEPTANTIIQESRRKVCPPAKSFKQRSFHVQGKRSKLIWLWCVAPSIVIIATVITIGIVDYKIGGAKKLRSCWRNGAHLHALTHTHKKTERKKEERPHCCRICSLLSREESIPLNTCCVCVVVQLFDIYIYI